MSRYKLLRYTPQSVKEEQINWHLVDQELRESIEYYNDIKCTPVTSDGKRGKKQPHFIDLIIKITICRAYANLNNKKILTAEKILESTRKLIGYLNLG